MKRRGTGRSATRGKEVARFAAALTPREILVPNLQVRVRRLLAPVVVSLREDVRRKAHNARKAHESHVPPHVRVGCQSEGGGERGERAMVGQSP